MAAKNTRPADKEIAAVRNILKKGKIVCLTGAGISFESGIPTFRGKGGLWETYDPEIYGNMPGLVSVFRKSPEKLVGFISDFYNVLLRSKPNPAHLSLSYLEKSSLLKSVITQNIDNLHQSSGFAERDIVELHGNTTYAVCLDCAERYELSWVREKFEQAGQRAPDCSCGGHIKTATISFGQAMPTEAMQRAEALTKSCDLFLAVGSSLVVWPAAGFPLMAKRNGAALVIINREPTEFDDIADLVVRNDIGDALAPFIAH